METLINGDCLEELKDIAENSVDAVITDPPYGISFMGKHWDKGVPSAEIWAECLRILKPGGFLLSFAGTRTQHRMATNIEDAGFEIRDMIAWVYGSGFPKSHNIGKAVDKLQGNERELIETNETAPDIRANNYSNSNGKKRLKVNKSVGSSDFEGWGTTLKPALEPITMARKPLSEKTVAQNCLEWGTGGINVDESRVGTEKIMIRGGGNITKDGEKTFLLSKEINQEHIGRFPANLIHDGSEEVRECFPETKNGGKKNAERKTKGSGGEKTGNIYGVYAPYKKIETFGGDQGNASRFFKSIIYQSKANKKERGSSNNHPTVKPVKLMEYLIKMVSKENATILDPFIGSGTTGVAAINTNRNFIGIELDENYFKIAQERIKAAKAEIDNSFFRG